MTDDPTMGEYRESSARQGLHRGRGEDVEMIDFLEEELVTLSEAAKIVPGSQSRRGVNVSTVWRWTMKGAKGVKLETIMRGGVRFTSKEALQRFFTRTTAAADGMPAPVATPAIRRRAIEAAERELAADGI
jgi:Protein of unknown function (DUF1580)